MEEDDHTEAIAVAEAPSHGPGSLDERVDAFGADVRDVVAEVGADILPVPLEREGELLDGVEMAATCPVEPLLEVLVGDAWVDIVEEGHEVLLDGPGTRGLELVVPHALQERPPLIESEVPWVAQPIAPGSLWASRGLVEKDACVVSCTGGAVPAMPDKSIAPRGVPTGNKLHRIEGERSAHLMDARSASAGSKGRLMKSPLPAE